MDRPPSWRCAEALPEADVTDVIVRFTGDHELPLEATAELRRQFGG